MATEILALTPQASAPDTPSEPEALVVSEDLNVGGKSRKKRFRLR